MHGLDYEVDVDRWVVTIDDAYLRQINAELREFCTLWSAPRLIPLAGSTQTGIELYRLIGDLKREAESHAVGHIAGTRALLTMLLLLLVRKRSSISGSPTVKRATTFALSTVFAS